MGLPRVQEIFEARIPGGKATISQVDGIVSEVTQDRIIRINPTDEKGKAKAKAKKTEDGKDSSLLEYQIAPKCGILVEAGQEVHKGDPLCEGSLDLKELFKATGISKAQNYIVSEVQRIYVSQGAQIHDKHIETIVRQMFSRVRVKEPGDSFLIPGEVLERTKFLEINSVLKSAGKNPAKGVPVLLGISRVALTTNSWLSSASFQETSRVLIKASLEGKEDGLKGLKENVIIGKLIPAGTGYKKEKEN
jgi:DNA-directed RNA polymerase subunit beta'